MKKLLLMLIAAGAGVLSLAGAEPLTIGCTTYPVWLLTREITANVKNVRTELLIPAGTGCPHDYVLTPADMRKLGTKNLLVVRNGLGLVDFVLKPLQKMNPKAPVMEVCRGLPVLYSECGHDHDHDHDHDHGHGHGHGHGEHHHEHHAHPNPHLFASPDMARGIAANIAEGLCRADSANAAAYRKNAAEHDRKLRGLTDEMAQLKESVRGKSIVVQHGVFDYLARALELKTAAAIQSEGTAPSAAAMLKLVKIIREHHVAVIFTEPQYSANNAKTLARECRIPVCQLDPLAGGPADPPRDHYVNVMRENLKKIREVLVK